MDQETRSACLLLDQDMTAGGVQHFELAGGRGVTFSARCPGKDGPNEDGILLVPVGTDTAILAIADGAGGLRGGAIASDVALRALQRAVLQVSEGASLREAILTGFEDANRAVVELGVGAGTTLAVTELCAGTGRTYHAGDSAILLVGQRGRMKLQTVLHSPTGYAVEAGFMDEAEALHHSERHLVSNMLGSTSMRLEIGSSVGLAPRDTLLLATDGLVDNMTTEEIVEIVRKGPLEKAGRRLAELSSERMRDISGGLPSKPDDLTFVLFRRTPAR